jgi:hypothetical protein
VKRGAETGAAASVPRNFEEVADAVALYRDALMSGGVFPEGYADALVERMRR